MRRRFGFDHGSFTSEIRTRRIRSCLAQPIGDIESTLPQRPGEPIDLERLVGTAIMEALRERDVPVDGAMHGVFDERSNFVAGPKTINDIWNVLPYENYVVTAELLPDEIKMIMEEVYASHERRNLLGFEVRTERRGYECRVTSMTFEDGRPLDRGKKYAIAFNAFDSRSAGHRFMKLRTLLETPSANCTLHQVQTRDALIDYFRRHRIVHKIAAAGKLAVAA
jgi:2',3'-cyclic-nucleotide 2'-phosphodiesterase (5'-nucleotidase family)